LANKKFVLSGGRGMREIKFRVWDESKKVMLSQVGSWYFNDEYNEVVFHMNDVTFSDRKYLKLMQYTGLKDKNGIDIYEGDILLVTSEIYTNFGKTPTGRFSKEYYEVIWKDDGWGHKVLKSDHTIEGTEIKGLKVTTKYVEVIGNRYANPELLEGIEYESKME
jgi:uncharacterized phage protein (TIGR01671 family)